MFGKPAWFREKQFGWGLIPVRWQGWLYAATWLFVLIAPFLLLLFRMQAIQAVVWMLVMMTALFADVRSILKAMRREATAPPQPATTPLLYIDDDKTPVVTRNFDLQLRR